MKKISLLILLIISFSFKLEDVKSIYKIPMQANAVCVADLDLDGDLDIISKHSINTQTDWGGIYELENNGFGNFTYSDSIYDTVGIWTVFADTVLSEIYPDIVYHNNGNIKFLSTNENGYEISQYQTGNYVSDFSLGDVDGNGELDVVFISNLSQYWGILFNQGDHTFSEPLYFETYNPPNDIACKDLDGDNKDEVIVGGGSFITEIWTYNNGVFVSQKLIFGATNIDIADFDRDGDKDIITVSDLMVVSLAHLYENLGNDSFGTVNNFTFPEGCSDLLIADFNNDSLPDILLQTFVYADNSGYLLYYNQGDFQMGEPDFIELTVYGEARRFTCVGDMDGNGYDDIIVTRQVFDTAYAPSYLEILFNDGHGNFGENPLTSISNELKTADADIRSYPNPFHLETRIEFIVEKKCQVDLSVFNLKGQIIKSLVINTLDKGQYKVTWDGADKNGKEVKSEIYIIRLTAGGQTSSCRIIKNN